MMTQEEAKLKIDEAYEALVAFRAIAADKNYNDDFWRKSKASNKFIDDPTFCVLLKFIDDPIFCVLLLDYFCRDEYLTKNVAKKKLRVIK